MPKSKPPRDMDSTRITASERCEVGTERGTSHNLCPIFYR